MKCPVCGSRNILPLGVVGALEDYTCLACDTEFSTGLGGTAVIVTAPDEEDDDDGGSDR